MLRHDLHLVPLACNFIKKETLAQVFSCEYSEICKNIFFNRTSSVPACFFKDIVVHSVTKTVVIEQFSNLPSVCLIILEN